MSVPPFVPAVDLSRAFYAEAVRPLLGGRPHSAALLGWGSDVLGHDTERSTDHGWGPRLLVFLPTSVRVGVESAELTADLDARLPARFRGWPVRFGWDDVQPRLQITVGTLGDWVVGQLGMDATVGLTDLDWLLVPQQQLLGVTAGAVFADDDGALARLRHELAWYPDQVWRWLLACQWNRLGQEEAFVARTAEVGDDTGSAVTAARLVRDAMRLALLLDRRYAPYQKWLGSSFARAEHDRHHDGHPDDGLSAHLADAVRATAAPDRESALARAYRALASRQNASGLTALLDPSTRRYHARPAQVLLAERFARSCLDTVTDPALRALPLVGGIDQVVDSTDVLADPRLCRRLAGLYRAAATGPAPST